MDQQSVQIESNHVTVKFFIDAPDFAIIAIDISTHFFQNSYSKTIYFKIKFIY